MDMKKYFRSTVEELSSDSKVKNSVGVFLRIFNGSVQEMTQETVIRMAKNVLKGSRYYNDPAHIASVYAVACDIQGVDCDLYVGKSDGSTEYNVFVTDVENNKRYFGGSVDNMADLVEV